MERDVLIAGATGRVGGAFLARLSSEAQRLMREGLRLRLCGSFSSTRMSFDRSGLDPSDGLPREAWDGDWSRFVSELTAAPPTNAVLVDCTASAQLVDVYPEILSAGVSIVAANKLAWSGSLSAYVELERSARRGSAHTAYETTVGAALPMLSTVRSVVKAGDTVVDITGVLSGTLSFVLSRVNEGVPFSSAVRQARDLGLTEPNPREDLSGVDVARKLLILMREAGHRPEPADVEAESLVPSELEHEDDAERFLTGLESTDESWATRAREARQAGDRLVYVASTTPRPRAAIAKLPAASSLGRLRPLENALELSTTLYSSRPLLVAGPGAGPEVTAMGVFADLLQLSSAEVVHSDPGGTKPR